MILPDVTLLSVWRESLQIDWYSLPNFVTIDHYIGCYIGCYIGHRISNDQWLKRPQTVALFNHYSL
jgi:hypothetical protein